jgi:broad specificity phosphatase PhoE
VRRSLFGLAILGLAAGIATAPAASAAPERGDTTTTTTTVIVVRHAEKNPHPAGGDAGLATKGTLRAQELARVLKDAGVSAVYVSQYGRARLTGEPLARALSDTVRTYDANRNDLVAARIRAEHAGGTVLVVGHGDSVLELIAALTGEPLTAGEAVDYDRMFVVTLGPRGAHRVMRLRYGAAPG